MKLPKVPVKSKELDQMKATLDALEVEAAEVAFDLQEAEAEAVRVSMDTEAFAAAENRVIEMTNRSAPLQSRIARLKQAYGNAETVERERQFAEMAHGVTKAIQARGAELGRVAKAKDEEVARHRQALVSLGRERDAAEDILIRAEAALRDFLGLTSSMPLDPWLKQ